MTRDFGHQRLGPIAVREQVRDSDTAMRFLASERKVTTRYGGGFVQSIDGLSGSKQGQHDWFYYVNGAEASTGAADFKLSPGDVEQWDFHDWSATMQVPAIVGAYPEPFLHGLEGKRLPTRVECDSSTQKACDTVSNVLGGIGVTATSAALGVSSGQDMLRVEVGKWANVKQTGAGRAIAAGPGQSGVFARFDASGRLEELGTSGRKVALAPPGSGLVAATQPSGDAIVWVITGADAAGVQRAAAAVGQQTLRDAFAVAATPSGVVRLPLVGAGA